MHLPLQVRQMKLQTFQWSVVAPEESKLLMLVTKVSETAKSRLNSSSWSHSSVQWKIEPLSGNASARDFRWIVCGHSTSDSSQKLVSTRFPETPSLNSSNSSQRPSLRLQASLKSFLLGTATRGRPHFYFVLTRIPSTTAFKIRLESISKSGLSRSTIRLPRCKSGTLQVRNDSDRYRRPTSGMLTGASLSMTSRIRNPSMP